MAEEEQTPNELWEEVKEVMNTAAKKHVSQRKNQKQPWLTNETIGVADERRQAMVTCDVGYQMYDDVDDSYNLWYHQFSLEMY